MKLEMSWTLTKQRHVQIAVWFPKTKAYESLIIPRENKLIDDKMRKSSYTKFEMLHLCFFHPGCFCCLEELKGMWSRWLEVLGRVFINSESHLPLNIIESFCCLSCIYPRQISGCFLLTFRFWYSFLFSG